MPLAQERATSKIPSLNVAHVVLVHGPSWVWTMSLLGREGLLFVPPCFLFVLDLPLSIPLSPLFL